MEPIPPAFSANTCARSRRTSGDRTRVKHQV
jgi:hypothetical protein